MYVVIYKIKSRLCVFTKVLYVALLAWSVNVMSSILAIKNAQI